MLSNRRSLLAGVMILFVKPLAMLQTASRAGLSPPLSPIGVKLGGTLFQTRNCAGLVPRRVSSI
jgi:hypothetical protein